jgi:hypothetical protein
MRVLLVHQTLGIEIGILHTMMKVGRIKMKVFPTHKWLGTWAYEGIVNSKIKIKNPNNCGIRWAKKTPHQPSWECGESSKKK